MASRTRPPRRLLLAATLGAILAGEITGIALGRALPPTVVPVAAQATPAAATAHASGATRDEIAELRDSRAERVRIGVDLPTRRPLAARTVAGRTLTADPGAKKTATHSAAPSAARAKSSSSGSGSISAARYHGVNHVWIPSLGINKGVQSFPCSRTRPPDAGVYRWGCAGRNNVYLLSHAWSTFKPLHDAYVRGTLRKGMRVWYADGGGHTHEYRVIWWRVTAPTTAASWAWAALPSPGMTLQTCVGANSEYRLMVRLDRVD